MIVGVTGFGSVWRRRIRDDGSGRSRFAQMSYFNTTGVMVNGRLVRHRKIAGHVRMDGISGFNPNYPCRAIGKVFECAEPCVWNGQNKVLFRRLLHAAARPDCFLVVTRSAEVGHLDLTASDWKSDDSRLRPPLKPLPQSSQHSRFHRLNRSLLQLFKWCRKMGGELCMALLLALVPLMLFPMCK